MHVSAEGAKYTSADCRSLDWGNMPTTPTNTIRSHSSPKQGLMSPSEQIQFLTENSSDVLHAHLLETFSKTSISVRDERLLVSAVYIGEDHLAIPALVPSAQRVSANTEVQYTSVGRNILWTTVHLQSSSRQVTAARNTPNLECFPYQRMK